MIDKIDTDVTRLRGVSEPVAFDAKTRFLAARLQRVLDAHRALGVAAPQIRVMRRVFAYNLRRYPAGRGIASTGVVCNPTVVEVSDETARMYEGCLSFPKVRFEVERPVSATFTWFDPKAGDHTAELSGMACRVFLHEIDHLDGVVASDRAVPGSAPLPR